MAWSFSSLPLIPVARRRSYRLTTSILNPNISIPFNSPRRVSFIGRHQCAVVDASWQVFVPQTLVVNRNSVSLAECKTEEELWAAVRLRIRTFYEFDQSSVGVEDHRTGLTKREFEALKQRVSGKSLGFRRVSCLNATLPLSMAAVPPTVRDLCSVCKFCQNGEQQVVIGTLDVNQCLKMVDELTGKKPQGIGADITRAYLSNVCVAKELQRNGVAHALITKAITLARSWGQTTIKNTESPIYTCTLRLIMRRPGDCTRSAVLFMRARRRLGKPDIWVDPDGIFCGEISLSPPATRSSEPQTRPVWQLLY